MPELPEVETTRRGLSPYLVRQRIVAVKVREPRLRWPVPDTLARCLTGQTIQHLGRRAKYLLLQTATGALIIHLGMSGSLRVVPRDTPPNKHDHVDLVLETGHCVRLRDPRRFGSMLWTDRDPLEHPLLARLGPEPLTEDFHGWWLYQRSRQRRMPVKSFVMYSRIVVGVGNIYANEALFLARIHPARRTDRISQRRYHGLAGAIKQVLEEAIAAGGTSLRDFVDSTGQPGYFSQRLRVYGRIGETCERCSNPLRQCRIGQRSTFYCSHCQR